MADSSLRVSSDGRPAGLDAGSPRRLVDEHSTRHDDGDGPAPGSLSRSAAAACGWVSVTPLEDVSWTSVVPFVEEPDLR